MTSILVRSLRTLQARFPMLQMSGRGVRRSAPADHIGRRRLPQRGPLGPAAHSRQVRLTQSSAGTTDRQTDRQCFNTPFFIAAC